MNRPRLRAVFALSLLATALLSIVPGHLLAQPVASEASKPDAEKSAPGSEWMRFAEDDKGKPLGMQTAVVRYEGPLAEGGPNVIVDLIGAVHVGDAGYYEQLNKLFEQYDTLLYELVAPKGTIVEKGTKASNRHALGAMQNGMKNMLALEHQLEQIDYTKSNFVHADMSPDEFLSTMKSRDESFLKLYFRVMGESLAAQSNASRKGDTGEADMIKAMFAKPEDRSRQLKIAMAKQMTTLGDMFTTLGGEQGTTIINGRNEAAFKVLREQLAAGRVKIGVFYGAGHLDDMHKRLKKDFGLEPKSVTWLTAWDLSE